MAVDTGLLIMATMVGSILGIYILHLNWENYYFYHQEYYYYYYHYYQLTEEQIGIVILFICLMIWHYSTKGSSSSSLLYAKLTQQDGLSTNGYASGGRKSPTATANTFRLNQQQEGRRYSIPDTSPSFDLARNDDNSIYTTTTTIPPPPPSLNTHNTLNTHNQRSPTMRSPSPPPPLGIGSLSLEENNLYTNDNDVDGDNYDVHECIVSYTPKKSDDMPMMLGDLISISMTFTDGWGHGINRTTGLNGMFPLSCIRFTSEPKTPGLPSNNVNNTSNSTNATTASFNNFQFPPLAAEGEGKLLFSTVPADHALEIITASMSPERRRQYFNDLLKNEGGGSLINSDSSLNKGGGATSSSLQDINGRTSKASKNWSRLRTGWKDAVKADLNTGYEQWEAQRNHSSFWRLFAENYST